jgi:hypothetical protein
VSTDFSVAPEIAQLAASFVPRADAPRPATAGRRAGELAAVAAAPQRWWDLVRFDPEAPVRVRLPGADDLWLLIVPPGFVTDCDCGYSTLIAGEATEGGRSLRSGRVLLHGGGLGGRGRRPHTVVGAEHGYSVSLHVKPL